MQVNRGERLHDGRDRGCTVFALGLQVCTLCINDFPSHPVSGDILFSYADLPVSDTMEQRVQDMMRLMSSKIRSIADTLVDDEISRFLEEMLRANRIYVMGAGRSGLVAKAFAMRLMHLGISAFVVGETITPAMKPGDLMIVFSGSGKTKTVADIAETAKEIGGRICLITSNADSRIGKISDVIVIIEHQRDDVEDDAVEFEIRQMTGEHKSFAPLGTIFETAAMVFADAIISRLMEIKEIDERELRTHHTNIE
jgi:6-phospho-3-hexuloisomerase